MKTLLFHVSNFGTGGIEKVLLGLLHGLDARKYRIILVIAHDLRDCEKWRSEIPPHVEVRRVLDKRWQNRVRYKKATGRIHPLEKAFWELFLPRVIRQQHLRKYRKWAAEADVIIDFDTTLAPYVHLFPETRTAAYCHFAFHTMWDGQKSKLDRLAARLMQYDVVVMLCDEMKDKTAMLYPQLSSRLFRLYNALDFERIAAQSKQWPPAWMQLQSEPYFVAVGRLNEQQKDFSTVIRAYAAALRESSFPEKLVIVGDGGDRLLLEAVAAAEGITERVIFTGFQANPYPFIAGARAFLFGSKFEGLPTVLIEAHALRIPVIATECPTGVRELLAGGKAGILTPVGDVAAMKDGILALLSERDLPGWLLAGTEKILPLFSLEYALAELERGVIGEVSGKEQTPRGGVE